ncbi:GH36-type glycosyl hydrolase domain-containing protein [Fontivita pretiosa]|uniref:GH36-type glycosyl hydrolase domain-containing protein n=1 Tax=Fontivita pretiosa TaxID=2989684 RepID=UPI003D163C90
MPIERIDLIDETTFPLHVLPAGNGLSLKALAGGWLYAIEQQRDGILINQHLGSPVAGSVHRLYVRRLDALGAVIDYVQIIGPQHAGQFAAAADRLLWSGDGHSLRYVCTAWVHPSGQAWFFHLQITNCCDQPIHCDAILVQDLALASRAQARNNPLYTSHYLDHLAMEHPQVGYVLMTRQNLAQAGQKHPWLLQGCLPAARGFTTDGFDFFGAAHRGQAPPQALAKPLIGQRVRQYETAFTAIQSSGLTIEPGSSQQISFFAYYLSNHPDRSTAADLQRLEHVQQMHRDMLQVLATPVELIRPSWPGTVFQTAGAFSGEELSVGQLAELFPEPCRHRESLDGKAASFFYGQDSRHVVLKAKELSVARPHGHILRAGRGWFPDSELTSVTCYAAGGFASQLTLGNASLAKLLSTQRDPLELIRSNGLRIFVRRQSDPAGNWQLLTVPSAFEMALNQCRWIYRHGSDLLTVSCIAREDDPAITYQIRNAGGPVELLVCGEIAAGSEEYEDRPRLMLDRQRARITIRPGEKSLVGKRQPNLVFHVVSGDADVICGIGADELLFPDRQRRALPYFTIQTRPTNRFSFSVVGAIDDPNRAEQLCQLYGTVASTDAQPAFEPAGRFWSALTRNTRLSLPDQPSIAALNDCLPWFARDAMIHLATPRGLEQTNGGAWGVRDVCQGPVEFLLAHDQPQVVADILRKVFSQQYRHRHDWPQWFMFRPFEQIQSTHCHGDVLIWPLKALCDYLEHTNDPSLLHERLPYTDEQTFGPTDDAETLLEHTDRLLNRMCQQFLPGVNLPRFGDGDWDDSLQPADPSLRDRMVSAWTAALMYQTLRRFALAMNHFGQSRRAAAATDIADAIEQDFQRHLMPDGVVAGFAIFDLATHPARPLEYLLHPSDRRTGLRYRLIPMTRGILSGIFTPAQAQRHMELLREHLVCPDGARLMDRPSVYQGGLERTFRRSESAAFFGREIGLQYVHAHLRYAEAMAAIGQAQELWHALLVVNPIAVTGIVPNAAPRQRNCYFSSSDAAFFDRYQASREYEKVRRGEIRVEGGWRIYSSGPGIYTSIVFRQLLGLRRHYGQLEFDPVLPAELDGATCELTYQTIPLRYVFRVSGNGAGAQRVRVNGAELKTRRVENKYRPGGLRAGQAEFHALLKHAENVVEIEL